MHIFLIIHGIPPYILNLKYLFELYVVAHKKCPHCQFASKSAPPFASKSAPLCHRFFISKKLSFFEDGFLDLRYTEDGREA